MKAVGAPPEGHRVEILDADSRPLSCRGATGDRCGGIGTAVWTGMEGGGEIHLLLDGVDQAAALRIGYHQIEEADRGRGGTHQRMIDSVQSAIFATVGSVVEQFSPGLRMRIGDDVMILKIIGSG